jgi:hypothetical protein
VQSSLDNHNLCYFSYLTQNYSSAILNPAQHASFLLACGVLALSSLRLFEVQAMPGAPSHDQPISARVLSQLTLDRSRRKDRAHRGAIRVTSRHDARAYQRPSSTGNSFAMTILPVSSLESRFCKQNRKSLKIGYLNIELSPMFGRSYSQVIENGDLTNFIFPRFFSCNIHFVSTS